MKRKMLSMLLCGMLLCGLTACGTETATEVQTTAQATENDMSSTAANDGETTADTDATSGSKTLVVYYSASGNTEKVANMIAEETDADLFQLQPVDVYTSDDLNYRNNSSRVSIEHDNPENREVALQAYTVGNWSEYDTVYIGYPIWWGIAAWPVDGFVKANDFTGKNVIPFATAVSSGMGQSGTLLEQMAGTGHWLEGDCFRSNVSVSQIQQWITSLG